MRIFLRLRLWPIRRIHPLNPAFVPKGSPARLFACEQVQSLEAMSRCTFLKRRTSYLEEIYDEPIQRSSRR